MTEKEIEIINSQAVAIMERHPDYTWGGAFFDALYFFHPNVANEIRYTEYDPRSNNRVKKCINFILKIVHVVCFSKGHSSALVSIELVREFGKENVILVNHNINPKKEDADIKRFGNEVAAYLDIPITFVNYKGIQDENNIPDQFQIAKSKKAFKAPNTSDATCTYELKTKPFFDWIELNFPKQDCMIYYGFDSNETARIARKKAMMGLIGLGVDFPLALWERTILSTTEIGITPPNTYSVYKHANCKGCLKAGIQHWYVTYVNEYEIFCEGKDCEIYLGYTILRKSIKGKLVPFSLTEFEPVFEKMKAAGIPATEHFSSLLFRRALKEFGITEFGKYMPCECMI